MRRAWAVVLLLCAWAPAKDDQVQTARLEWEPSFLGTITGGARPLSKSPPDGVIVPEKLVDPRFATIVLAGATKVHLAVDLDSKMHRLWLDSNLDGNLAKEIARAWYWRDGGFWSDDTVLVPIEGESEPLPVKLKFFRRSSEKIYVYTHIHRRGRVEIGGRLRPVALIDGDGDLLFSHPEKDVLYVDIDGDRKLTSKAGSYERVRTGEPFRLGNKGYVARIVDTAGARVEFRRSAKTPPERPRWDCHRWAIPPAGVEPGRVKETLAELTARFEKDKIATLAAIGPVGSREAFDFLERVALEDKALDVRVAAIRAMGYEPYANQAARVAKLAEKALQTRERVAAIEALHAMGARDRAKVYAAILAKARNEKWEKVLKAAARHLAYMGTSRSRKGLLKAFREQSNHTLREHLYEAATHGDPKGPPKGMLKEALNDKRSEHIRKRAMWDLWLLRDPKSRAFAQNVLKHDAWLTSVLEAAATIMAAEPDDETFEAIFERIPSGSSNLWNRLVTVLRPLRGPKSVNAMIQGLGHDEPRVRAMCAELLRVIDDEAVTRALVQAIRVEKNPEVQGWLAGALGEHGNPRAFAELFKLARKKEFAGRGEVVRALARLGFGHDKVREFFLKLMDSPKWEDRVLALDTAGRSGDPTVTAATLSNLDHKAWQVRVTAVEALGRLRVKEAVEPLIWRLEVEEMPRIRTTIGNALFRITGQDFGRLADVWRRWWKQHGATFAVPDAIPRRTLKKGHTGPSFYGVPVRSKRICFVLDRSGSMDAVDPRSKTKATRFEVAAAEVLKTTSKLKDAARVNVVFFDTNVSSWRKSLASLSPGARGDLKKHLGAQTPRGETNLYGGLERAFEEKDVDTILVLSDGVPSEGTYTDNQNILYAVWRMNLTRRVTIHTVAVGRNSKLLKQLAEYHGGTYVRR